MFNDPRWAALALSDAEKTKLRHYNELLQDKGQRLNLVAKSTLAQAEERHFLDSAQLYPLIPKGSKTLVDFGSGAGFPALVLAILCENREEFPDLHISMIESTGKKCVFLQTVATELDLKNVSIRNERVESGNKIKADVITARAVGNLEKLLSYSESYFGSETVLLFPKGERVAEELTQCAAHWKMDVIPHQSVTQDAAQILEIRNISRV